MTISRCWQIPGVLVFLAAELFRAGPSIASAPQDVLPLSVADNRIFVSVKINDLGPFSFLADTGSNVTTISPQLAKLVGPVQAPDHTGRGAGENRVSYSEMHIASAILGNISIGPLDAPVIDLDRLSHVVGFGRCDGVLGLEVFQSHVVTIDRDRQQFIIQDPSRFKAPMDAMAVPITFESGSNSSDISGMPLVEGEINGIKGQFEVDTGDRASLTLFGPFWRDHHLERSIGQTVTSMTGYGIGGPILSIVGRPDNFTVHGISVPPPVTRLSLQKSGSFSRNNYAGSIGMGILKRFVVSFDFSRRMMWLVKGAHFGSPDQYDRSGLWLGLAGPGALTVVDVAPGSPAAAAGIKAGDEVKEVAGIPANPDTLFSLRALLSEPGRQTATLLVQRDGPAKLVLLTLQDRIEPPSP